MFPSDQSRQRRINPDGSKNVFCSRCTHFIATVGAHEQFYSALCVVCQLFDEGVSLTPAQVADLRAVRRNGMILSETVAYPPLPEDPLGELASNEIERQKGYRFKALVSGLRAAVRKAVKALPESGILAKTKKRRSIMDMPLDKE